MTKQAMLLAICTIIAAPAYAYADDTHYEGLPIGNQAIGIAGAYTGVAEDASAAYFNPAGLTREGVDGFAGGLSVFAFESVKLNDSLVDTLGSANFSAKRKRALPIFVATVKTFGPTTADGQKRFAIAYSTAQTRSSARTFDVALNRENNANDVDTLRVESSLRTNYHGLSFAWLANRRLSFGATTYFAITRRNHEEQTFLSAGGTFDSGTDVLSDGVAIAKVARYRVKAFHLVLRLGTTYDINDKVRLGVLLQAPGIPISRKGKFRGQSVNIDQTTAPGGPTLSFDKISSTGRAPIPFQLKVGVGFRPTTSWLLSGDVGLTGPVKGKSVVSDAGANTDGIFFPNTTKRNAVVNVAVGAEHTTWKKLVLRAGAFTDLSAAPKIPSAPGQYLPERIHRFGVAAAIGFRMASLDLSVGSTTSFGKGNAVGVNSEIARDRFAYAQRGAKSRTIIFHISGAKSAIRELAKVVSK